MTKLNEELQMHILTRLEDELGEYGVTFKEETNDKITSHPDFVFNMEYLKGSGLIGYKGLDRYGDDKILILFVKITSHGINFLNDKKYPSLMKEDILNNNNHHTKDNFIQNWYDKPIGKVGIAVFSGVLISMVIYLITHYLKIPL